MQTQRRNQTQFDIVLTKQQFLELLKITAQANCSLRHSRRVMKRVDFRNVGEDQVEGPDCRYLSMMVCHLRATILTL
ncbi:hypothetical protein OH492_11540 [Vibrio chagasii]|nr:hypothetical protein [Vibrio chagasii]